MKKPKKIVEIDGNLKDLIGSFYDFWDPTIGSMNLKNHFWSVPSFKKWKK